MKPCTSISGKSLHLHKSFGSFGSLTLQRHTHVTAAKKDCSHQAAVRKACRRAQALSPSCSRRGCIDSRGLVRLCAAMSHHEISGHPWTRKTSSGHCALLHNATVLADSSNSEQLHRCRHNACLLRCLLGRIPDRWPAAPPPAGSTVFPVLLKLSTLGALGAQWIFQARH